MSAGGEKTEKPTPKKLRDARQKGQVAFSRDVTGALILIVLFAYIGLSFDWCMQELRNLVDHIASLYEAPFIDAVKTALAATCVCMLKLSIPPVLLAAAVGVAGGFFQVGPLIAFEAIKPELNKMNPVEGAKKIFSMKNLIEFVKNLVKLIFISYLTYKVVLEAIPELVTLTYGGIDAVLPATEAMLKRICIYTSLGFVVIAAADVFLQRRQHLKGLMMSREEIKQEYKQMEGSPEVKGHRRQLHRELLSDAGGGVKKASAVVTNPVHYAVALYYEKGVTPLPVVTAKGKGLRALEIRREAEELGIPVMENVPLARMLYHQAELEEYIPRELLGPVAQVLHWAAEVRRAREGGAEE